MAKNVSLIKKIIKHLESRARFQFIMSRWGATIYSDSTGEICNTSQYVGGDAMILSGYKLVGHNTFVRPDGTPVLYEVEEAQKLLGFTRDQARNVFSSALWPPKFRMLYENAESNRERKLVGVARLKYLLRTGR